METPAPTENTPPASFSERIFSDTGEVREDYGEALKEAGLESAAGVFKKYKDRDAYLKGTLNAHALASKRVDQWSQAEIEALPPEVKENLAGKINGKPDSPDAYSFEFAGDNLHPQAAEFWGPKIHEAGLSQSQLESLLPALDEWHESLIAEGDENQTQQTAQAQAETKQHFESEWGENFGRNRIMVESFADANLDAENPLHSALLNDKTGIDLIYRLALAEMHGRAEGKAPTEGDVIGADNPQEEMTRLMAENPRWREQPDSSQAKRIKYLGDVLARKRA